MSPTRPGCVQVVKKNMSPVTRAYLFAGLIKHRTAQRILEPIARRLRTGQPSDTVDRLFASMHVNDLRLIAAVAFIVVVWIGVLTLLDGAVMEVVSHPDRGFLAQLVPVAVAAGKEFATLAGPALVVFGAIMAWAYQVGSARLGVVDLFACEIDTLCRMTTIIDLVPRQIAVFNGPPPEKKAADGSKLTMGQFVSEENYFPVFESNSRDLQSLEATVVINITAFYTYMKAVRDSFRRLAEAVPSDYERKVPPDDRAAHGPWHECLRSMLYMLYLGLESARKATGDLVEFEPQRAERTIVILISELEAYVFLRECYGRSGDNMWQRRLALRKPVYDQLVPALHDQVKEAYQKIDPSASRASISPEDQIWCQAEALLDVLDEQYRRVNGGATEAVLCWSSRAG